MTKTSRAARLRELADELHQMADEVESGAESVFAFDDQLVQRPNLLSIKRLAGRAEAEYKARRSRSKYVPEKLLGEPVWDILLDLYVNEARGRVSNITSVCVASCAPPTTALRYVTSLEAQGLIEFEDANYDRRIRLVSFTERGLRAMSDYLQGAPAYQLVMAP